jgi:hypothetical protein
MSQAKKEKKTWMNDLPEYVRHCAERVVEDGNYSDPEHALFACSIATDLLGENMTELNVVSFEVEVRVTEIPPQSLWARSEETADNSEFLWHYVLAVPRVGIVDMTGSQLGRPPLRILEEPPDCWDKTRRINPKGVAPSVASVHRKLVGGSLEDAKWTFKTLMEARQTKNTKADGPLSSGRPINEGAGFS